MKRSVFLHRFYFLGVMLILSACGSHPNKSGSPAVELNSENIPQPQPKIIEPVKVVTPPPIEKIEIIQPIPVEIEPNKACVMPEPQLVVKKVINTPLTIIGAVEYVTIKDNDLRLKARIDTGAKTTSIGVDSFQLFERDGERWVQFAVKNRSTEKLVEFKRRLKRRVRIKQHEQESVRRQVVELTLTIGTITRKVEVTLNNRDNFKYPVLIGRNFLDHKAVVDVSSRYLMLDETN